MSDNRSVDDLAGQSGVRKQQPAGAADAKSSPKQPAASPSGKVAKGKPAPGASQAQAAVAIPASDDIGEGGPGWFGRTMIWASTAWGSSMVLHLLLLLVLGFWFLPDVVRPPTRDIEAVVEERPEEIITQVLEVDTTPSETLTVTSASASALSDGVESTVVAPEPPQVEMTVTEKQTDVTVDVGTANVFTSKGSSLATDVPLGTLGEALAVVEGYGDAMDRITQEILNKLARGKVLVVWNFDQSDSMTDDREEIMARIERVYAELGLSSAATGDALLTAVCSYGATMQVHTRAPTYNVEEIIEAIKSVQVDESGEERMCEAIAFAIAKHKQFAQQGRRQLMHILVTDESGDPKTNMQYLEAAIGEAKAARCPLYTLGREAVFGYPYIHLLWVDPETKEQFWIPLDRGPETPFPEQLQVDGYHRRYDAHPSGFGPYEQTRMARETGGIFFMLPSVEADIWRRDDRKYEIEAMRAYLPDLSARNDYATERDKYDSRRVLWKVIGDLNPYDPAKRDVVQVRVDFFAIDLPTFNRQAQENIARARRLIEYFKAAEQAMAGIRPQLAREASPRWVANFELTYAQTIAYQVRLYEYIACLEDFMKNPRPIKNIFGPNKPTTHWEIVRRAPFRLGEQHADQRERATALFKEVQAKHPGTPWAARADYELRRGWGCDFREEYHHPDRSKVKVPKK